MQNILQPTLQIETVLGLARKKNNKSNPQDDVWYGTT